MFKYVKFKELPVSDQDRALKFYTEKVGLKVAQEGQYQDDWRWIELEVGDNPTRILFSPRADENPSDAPVTMTAETFYPGGDYRVTELKFRAPTSGQSSFRNNKNMKRIILFAAVIAIFNLTVVKAQTETKGTSKNPNDAVVTQLKQATQELLDAIASGKREVWDKYLADGAIYTDEEGRVLTKDELLKELTPLPKGYVGTIKMGEPKVLVQDNVIVLSHLDREELELYGQKIVTYFHSTDTWAKQKNGQWRRVATQIMAIPNERKPAKIADLKILDDYVGEYQLAPDVFYTVTREGSQLLGQRTGRAREELLPLCGDIFYKKGVWRGEKVFERDAGGKIINLRDRRDNNDLVWKKIK